MVPQKLYSHFSCGKLVYLNHFRYSLSWHLEFQHNCATRTAYTVYKCLVIYSFRALQTARWCIFLHWRQLLYLNMIVYVQGSFMKEWQRDLLVISFMKEKCRDVLIIMRERTCVHICPGTHADSHWMLTVWAWYMYQGLRTQIVTKGFRWRNWFLDLMLSKELVVLNFFLNTLEFYLWISF